MSVNPPRRISYFLEVFHPLEQANPWQELQQRVVQGILQIFFLNRVDFDDHAESWALIETTEQVAQDLQVYYSVVEALQAIYQAPDGTEYVVIERGAPVQRPQDVDSEFIQLLRDNQDVI